MEPQIQPKNLHDSVERIIMKQHKFLVNQALADGYSVSVFDGEEWAVLGSEDKAEITGAIESVGASLIKILNKSKLVDRVLIVLDGDEKHTVVDYSISTNYVEESLKIWENIYDS